MADSSSRPDGGWLRGPQQPFGGGSRGGEGPKKPHAGLHHLNPQWIGNTWIPVRSDGLSFDRAKYVRQLGDKELQRSRGLWQAGQRRMPGFLRDGYAAKLQQPKRLPENVLSWEADRRKNRKDNQWMKDREERFTDRVDAWFQELGRLVDDVLNKYITREYRVECFLERNVPPLPRIFIHQAPSTDASTHSMAQNRGRNSAQDLVRCPHCPNQMPVSSLAKHIGRRHK
jgi:hypothetical protein